MKDDIIITCSRNFAAAVKKNIVKSKIVIDSDIMIIICHCDILLRLYNIPRIDKYSIYIIQFLKSILKNKSCLSKLIFFYDINCQFSKYIKIETRISCF